MRLYVGVTNLAELESQGQTFYAINWQAPNNLQSGSRGQQVSQLQYMLNVMAEYVPSIPPVAVDGIFGPRTRESVLAFQRFAGLPEDGIVGPQTWNALYDRAITLIKEPEIPLSQYAGETLRLGDSDFS